MANLMKTSNPALSGDTFRTGEATYGESMTVSGAVNKTGILVLCCVATAAWTWNRFFSAASPQEGMACGRPAARRRRYRRIHPGDSHHLQKGVVGDHRAHVRAAGRPGAGRDFSHAGDPLPRHRHPGCRPDLRDADRDAGGLSHRPHSASPTSCDSASLPPPAGSPSSTSCNSSWDSSACTSPPSTARDQSASVSASLW